LHYFKGLGIIPTPVPWGEIYTGLQTKTFDGMTGNWDWPILFGFHEPCKYIVPINNNYLQTVWTISEKRWQSLSPEDRKIIQDAAINWYIIEKAAYNMVKAKHMDLMKKMGKDTGGLPKEEQTALRKTSIKIIEPYVKKVWGEKIWERLNKEFYSK